MEKDNVKNPLDENQKTMKSNLDSKYDVNKAWLGVLLSCVLLIFSPIVGAVCFPKGTRARKTYMRACAITITVLIIVAVIVGVLVYVFVDLIGKVATGTVEGIVDGVTGAENIIEYCKLVLAAF